MNHKTLFALILLYGIFLRLLVGIGSPALFIEPDNYMYYSIAQQTAANDLNITSALSGFPEHNNYDEAPGLILIPIVVSTLTGFDIATSMHILALSFGIIGILLAYLFARKITENKTTALWAMLFMATLPAFILKTSWLSYRGETFVPILLGIILLFSLNINKRNWYIEIINICLIVLLIVLTLFMWNGAVYIIPVLALFCIGAYFKSHSMIRITVGLFVLTLIGWGIYNLHSPYFTNSDTLQINETQHPGFFFILANFFFTTLFAMVGLLYIVIATDFKLILGLLESFKIGMTSQTQDKKLYYIALLAILFPSMMLGFTQQRFIVLITLPVAIIAALGVEAFTKYLRFSLPDVLFRLMIIITLLMQIVIPFIQFGTATPAGYQTPQIFDALAWLKNNTAQNVTVLSFWTDGSMIEGIAQRQSYTDSVVGQNALHVLEFRDFALARAGNYLYLHKINPNYLLLRKNWLYYNQFRVNEIEGSNLQFLLTNQTSPELQRVYNNSEVVIYKVE